MASISLAGTFFASHGYDSWLLLILAAILLVGGSQLRGNSQDPREPPALKPKIPVVGHIIGLLGLRQYYYRQLGYVGSHILEFKFRPSETQQLTRRVWDRCSHENPNLPVFSISMGGSQKMYIIKDPQLSQVAMRNKALSLIPFMAEFAEKMVGFGPNIMNLFHHPPTDGSLSWTDDQHRSYAPLSPGPDLLEMNTYVLKRISQTINSVGPELENKTLYFWLRDAFTKATLGSLFGDKSSLTASPTLIQDLWDYDAGQSQLLMQPFPSITARQAYGGRSRVQQALRKYFLEEFDQISNVSAVVKRRVAVNRKWGLPSDDVADHEFGMLFASVTNAIPTLFWMTCYVFRDPKLVEELRKELLDIAVIQDQNETAADGQNVLQFHWPRKCTFPLAKLSSACPLLLSTYKEVMRLTNRNAGTRRVVEDTVISYTPTTAVGETAATQSYLLKKGANVQVPSIITNFDPATWGPNAHEFDARRFLAVDKERERTQSRAFNPFGSGKHLCPGRFFADAEILGALAALILGFEIETPEGGRVQVPPIKNNLSEAVPKPLQTVQDNMMVRIRRRPGWEDVEWAFVASNGKS